MKRRGSRLREIEILPQPDHTTCGPTSLHAIYRYWGDEVPLGRVIDEVTTIEGGGTLAVHLGCHALRRGYSARIYTYNLQAFDPTWFREGVDLREKLQRQRRYKSNLKIHANTYAYVDFLDLGGDVLLEDLTPSLLRRHLHRDVPILAGLSSTYLYRSPRQFGPDDDEDDIRGSPGGHFVVLCEYDPDERSVRVADPYEDNPVAEGRMYTVSIDRVVGAVLLGVLTHDANMLIIEPRNPTGTTGRKLRAAKPAGDGEASTGERQP